MTADRGHAPRAPWRGAWRGAPPSPGLAMLAELMNNHLDAGYAEAQRANELRQPPSALVARLRSVSSAVILVLIGVILALAYQQAVAREPDAARAKAGLVQDVKRRSTLTDQLQSQADKLREQVAKEREAALASTAAGQRTADELRTLEATVGVGPVSGPGTTVTAGDGPPPKDPVTGEITGENDPARLTDRDLQELVNALWRAGAEAMAVDGQRLTPTSTIRLAGEAILVDLRPVTSPYRIEVIGDPLTLDAQFTRSEVARRFRAYVSRYEITFDVANSSRINLPAAAAPLLRFAREPIPGTDASSSASPNASPDRAASPLASPSTRPRAARQPSSADRAPDAVPPASGGSR